MKRLFVNLLLALFWIAVFFWLSSCSAHKRIARIVRNNPELLQKDTIIIKDSVLVEIPGAIGEATISINDAINDTIVIRDSNVTITTHIYRDSIFIRAECDTIKEVVHFYKEIPIDNIVYRKARDGLIRYWLILFVVISIGLTILLFRVT